MLYKFVNLSRYGNTQQYVVIPRGLPVVVDSQHKALSPSQVQRQQTFNLLLWLWSCTKQATTCILPHTCLSAIADAAPEEKIVLSKHDFIRFLAYTPDKEKLNDSTTELDGAALFFSLCLTSF